MSRPGRARIVFGLVLVFGSWGGAATARAETTFGWRFTPPKGWTATPRADHVAYLKIAAPSFCQLALYRSRPMTSAREVEVGAEWKNLIETTFTATRREPAGKGVTRSGVPYSAVAATITDATGNAFHARLYVLMPPARVGSLFVTSGTKASMARCEPAVKALLDSLSPENGAAPSAASAAVPVVPVAPVAPVAPADALLGRWATSVAGNPNDGSPTIVRQYSFSANGTYRYHKEVWGGAHWSGEWMVIRERGTYQVNGDRLTVSPTSTSGVIRGVKKIRKKLTIPVERVTYRWQTHYFAGIEETNLVLTPPAKTSRDGEFASSGQFPASYLLSDQYEPAWTFKP